MLCLPLDGGILRFQAGKTIDSDLTICNGLLDRCDDLFGFCDGQWSKNTVRIQAIVLLKAGGSRF